MSGDRGHLRGDRGHLRGGRGLPTVPDLLATDALLDRLGSHRAGEDDLQDTVARLLNSYALHADPLTAGARALELPVVEGAGAPAGGSSPAAPEPRVLMARRRTLERLGRGTAAACAVLALLGGTAAAAATSGGHPDAVAGEVASPVTANLPAWFPDRVLEALGGTVKQRVQRELAQARADASSGEHEEAVERVSEVLTTLRTVDGDPQLVRSVQDALEQLQEQAAAAGVPVTGPAPAGASAPTGVPAPPRTLPGLVAAATPTVGATSRWVAPMAPEQPGEGTTQSPGDGTLSPTAPRPSTGTTAPTAPAVPSAPASPSGGSSGGGSTGAPVPPATGAPVPPATGSPAPPATGGAGTPAPSGSGGTAEPVPTGSGEPTGGADPTGEPAPTGPAGPTGPAEPTGAEPPAEQPVPSSEPAVPGTATGEPTGAPVAPEEPAGEPTEEPADEPTDPEASTTPVDVVAPGPGAEPSPEAGAAPSPSPQASGGGAAADPVADAPAGAPPDTPAEVLPGGSAEVPAQPSEEG
ncbi:hypothetical protein [Kineococcus esterisolvens]|uniref:hypothetical protein n=1 Tax=unclassified Kineococcus TaxID=2621656 RepID=UPI003D7E03B6